MECFSDLERHTIQSSTAVQSVEELYVPMSSFPGHIVQWEKRHASMSTVCHPLFNKKGSRRKYIMYLLICAEETQEILETKETGYI